MWRRAAEAGVLLALAVGAGLLGMGPAAAQTQVTVSPASGPPGTEIVVTGTGFAALPVDIRWGGLSGPTIATAMGPAFSVTAVVPDSPPNSHQVMAVVTDGGAVSTSSASFQVTEAPAPAPEEPTTTTTEPPPTTSPLVTAPASTGRTATEPPAGGRGGLSGGVDGGVDPDLSSTVNGGGPTGQAPAGGAGSTATSTATTVAAGVGAATTPTLTLPPGAEPGAAPPGGQGAATVPLARGEGETAAVELPARRSQSAGAVSNPAVFVAGLAMVFGGGVFLAVRNRQRA